MTEQNELARCTAVLLAAGKGTRLGGDLPKQYRDIAGIPLAARSLEALASSEIISDIVMVIPEGDEEYIREHIFPVVPEAARKVRNAITRLQTDWKPSPGPAAMCLFMTAQGRLLIMHRWDGCMRQFGNAALR